MAQLVAHLHGMERVRGSNPLSSTKKTGGIYRRFFVILTKPCNMCRIRAGDMLQQLGESMPAVEESVPQMAQSDSQLGEQSADLFGQISEGMGSNLVDGLSDHCSGLFGR